MRPLRVEGLDSVDDLPYRIFMSEDPDRAIDPAHRVAEVLGHDRRLVTGLEEEVGREEAARRLLEDHHRVPVVHVRSLEEPQRVLAELKLLAVLEAERTLLDTESARVQQDR